MKRGCHELILIMQPKPSQGVFTRCGLLATVLMLSSLGLTVAPVSAGAQTVVSISALDDTAAETAPGQPANPASIRVTRTGGTTAALTVWLKVVGSAAQGLDYTFSTGTIGSFVIIPAGSSSLTIFVNPRDDAFTEVSETIRIDLEDETSGGTPVPYAIGGDRAEVDLLDNEDPNLPPRAVVSVTQFGSQALESFSNSVTFRITREGNLSVPIQVRYTLGGTATAGEDFAAPPETISIPGGVTFADVNIVAINDPLVEGPETVTFTLAPHPNAGDVPPPLEAYALGFVTSAGITILSEDLPPPPVVTITSPVNGSSQSAPGTIDVAFHAVDPAGYVTRFVVTDGATVLASNVVSHPAPPANGTPFQYSLTLTNVRAGLRTFRARVWSSTGVAGTSSAVQSVVTNIPPVYPRMSVTALDAEAAEGLVDGQPNSAVFAITLDRPMPSDQYVVYRLSSPGPGFDFSFPTSYSATNWPMFWPVGPTDYGYAFFPTGLTRVEIVVTPVDDFINEGMETLTLTLSYPFVFTERTFEGIVQFTEGGFYTPPFDPYALPPRYFDYDLTTNNVATAVIHDNDTGPTPFAIVAITATDADAEETVPGVGAPNAGAFTISRVGPTNLPLVVNYQLTTRPRDVPLRFPIPVQAINGVDFVAIPHLGTAIIPAGAMSTEIVITPINDMISEIPEYVQIHLRPSLVPVPDASSYLLYTNSMASLVIRDLALPAFTPVVRIRTIDGQAIEQNAVSPHATFQVERQGNVAEPLAVPYAITGTAINGLDYVALPGVVNFPAGGRLANIVIIPYLDNENETNESVVLTLQPPSSNVFPPPYVLGSSGPLVTSAGATIREDAPPTGPIDRFERARRLRFPGRYRIVPLPVVPLPVLPEPPPALPVPAMIWAVEASSDLVVWEELGETEDPDEFVDVTAGENVQRFYRFREVPRVEP